MMKSLNKGFITIEASIVFIIFTISYIIVNSIALDIMAESITKKALFETGMEVTSYMNILDKFNLLNFVNTEKLDNSKYIDILSKGLENNFNKDIFLEFSNIIKKDISSFTKNKILKSLIKKLYISNLINLTNQEFINKNIVKGIEGINITDIKFLEEGRRVSLAIEYDFKLDKYNLFGFKNKVVQNFISDVWIKSGIDSIKNSIWNATNFERGIYFARKIRKNNLIPLKTGRGIDIYEDTTNTIVQVYSLNIFDKTYSSKKGDKYFINKKFIETIKVYYKNMLDNYNKHKGEFITENGEKISILKPKFKLLLILPEETNNLTNLQEINSEMQNIGNIEFLYMEKAIND